jgi:hypothetical protein
MVTFGPDLTAQIARDLGVHKEALRTCADDPGVESRGSCCWVQWDSVGAHLEKCRVSERLGAWRGQVGPYITAPPVFEHFTPSTDSPIRVADRAGRRRLRTGR